MATCVLTVVIWSIIAIIVLALIETALRLVWPIVPQVVIFLLRALCGLLIILWILGCIAHIPAPPGILR